MKLFDFKSSSSTERRYHRRQGRKAGEQLRTQLLVLVVATARTFHARTRPFISFLTVSSTVSELERKWRKGKLSISKHSLDPFSTDRGRAISCVSLSLDRFLSMTHCFETSFVVAITSASHIRGLVGTRKRRLLTNNRYSPRSNSCTHLGQAGRQ